MAVFRVEKNDNFTVMSNFHLKERKMSLKAVGLLSKMLSFRDDWDYSVAGLVAICLEGENAIKATLKELQDFGYLEINKVYPDKSSSGRIEYEYVVYETPKTIREQEPDFQGLENQAVEYRAQVNTKQVNTKKQTQPKGCGAERNLLKDSLAQQKKGRKAKDMVTMRNMISAFTANEDVQDALKQYFNIRIKKGLLPEQWQIILEDLRKFAGTDSTLAIEQIENAVAGGYMQIVAAWNKGKTAAQQKTKFDNTAGHTAEAVVNMTAEQRKEFEDSLAKDEHGNLLKF